MKHLCKYLFFLGLLFTLGIAVGCGDADGDGDSTTLNNGSDGGKKMTTRKVAITDVYLSHARFSPDGQRFALVHDDGEVESLATLGVDGTDLSLLAENANYLTAPTWTSDGASIVFYADDISRINPDGSGLESLLPAFAAMDLDLSPDDGHIVYGVNGGNLTIVGLQTRDSVTLDFSGNSPRYSPDGSQIAYITDSAIRVMDAQGADGRDVTTDTEDLSYLSSLDWFPDGERLAITSKRGIEIVDIATGTRSTLIDDFATKFIDVSPDGKSLVFGVNGQRYLTVVEGL